MAKELDRSAADSFPDRVTIETGEQEIRGLVHDLTMAARALDRMRRA
jgi:hypothetical protein